jgi:hypothetical protein
MDGCSCACTDAGLWNFLVYTRPWIMLHYQKHLPEEGCSDPLSNYSLLSHNLPEEGSTDPLSNFEDDTEALGPPEQSNCEDVATLTPQVLGESSKTECLEDVSLPSDVVASITPEQEFTRRTVKKDEIPP